MFPFIDNVRREGGKTMGFWDDAYEKNCRIMRQEVVDATLQKEEKIVSIGRATWAPDSRLVSWIRDDILSLTVGKFYIVCLTDRRLLLFDMPKFKRMSSSTLSFEVLREDVRIKKLGKAKFLTAERELTLTLGGAGDLRLTFQRPYNRVAELLGAEFPPA